MVTHSVGRSEPIATTQTVSLSPAPTWKVRSQEEGPSSEWKMPPPVFAEIVKSLHGDAPPCVDIEAPPELTKGQGPLQMVGSMMAMMVFTQLFQYVMSGTTYIDLVTCSMSLVGLGLPLDGQLPYAHTGGMGRHGF